MNVSNFRKPETYPLRMLRSAGLDYSSSNVEFVIQAEFLLIYMLTQSIEAGQWIAAKAGNFFTDNEYETLINRGLLKGMDIKDGYYKKYELTTTAKGFLYAYYGVEK